MNDLTVAQKQFISEKTKEYREYENKLNERNNELASLYEENRIKSKEYEIAKANLEEIKKEIVHDQNFLDDMMIRYVNKKEIKYVFSLFGKTFGAVALICLLLSLTGVINILSISDLVTYFFCAPGIMGTCGIMVASFFSNKKRAKFTRDFHNLDESIKLHEIIEKKIEDSKQKKLIFEEKKTAFKESKSQISQIEFKISSLKYAMDKIKTSIFETIYSNDDVVYTQDQSLKRKI